MRKFSYKSLLPLPSLAFGLLISLASCDSDRDSYEPIPVIVSLQPEAASPGQKLIILGGNFSPIAEENNVTINGVTVEVIAAQANKLEVIIPEDATDGVLSVIVNGQTGSARNLFDVIDELLIASISPEQATKHATITITGQYFGQTISDNLVTIQDVDATITGVNNGQLMVTVPEDTSLGQATVNVAANNQSITFENFEIIDYPKFSITNTLNTSAIDFKKISIVNENIAYAAGDDGLIAKSTAPGSWDIISYGTTNFRDVHTFDEQNVLVCGYGGLLIKTTDGGVNWSEVTIDTAENLRRFHFISSTEGWLVGSDGVVFKTVDGGETWQSLNSGIVGSLYGVFFIDANNGFAVGNDDHVIKTVDGGDNWEVTVLSTNEDLTSVAFIDDKTGWISGEDNVILHTTDGGNTWVNQGLSLDSSGDDFNDITIVSENHIIAVADDHQLAQSEDGGATWEIINLELALGKTIDLHFDGIDSYRGIAIIVGKEGFIGY